MSYFVVCSNLRCAGRAGSVRIDDAPEGASPGDHGGAGAPVNQILASPGGHGGAGAPVNRIQNRRSRAIATWESGIARSPEDWHEVETEKGYLLGCSIPCLEAALRQTIAPQVWFCRCDDQTCGTSAPATWLNGHPWKPDGWTERALDDWPIHGCSTIHFDRAWTQPQDRTPETATREGIKLDTPPKPTPRKSNN